MQVQDHSVYHYSTHLILRNREARSCRLFAFHFERKIFHQGELQVCFIGKRTDKQNV